MDLCTINAGWVDPGALNFAALTGLQPNTRYYYVVGDLVNTMSTLRTPLHLRPGPSLRSAHSGQQEK